MLSVKVALLKLDTEPKIYQLNLLVFTYHDILQLNITMSDVLRVQVRYCAYDLLEDYPAHVFRDLPPWLVLEVVKHCLLANVLHDQDNL